MIRNRRDVQRLARRYGLAVEVSSGSHWLLRDSTGRLIATVPRTPGSRDYLRFAEGDVRRYDRATAASK